MTESHEACCLADSQKVLRKTISVLMRVVEQVYSAIVLVGGNNDTTTSFAALARVPPIVLQQQTEQFILAAKTLESQVVAMTATTSENHRTSNISSLFNVVSAIRTALPRNF